MSDDKSPRKKLCPDTRSIRERLAAPPLLNPDPELERHFPQLVQTPAMFADPLNPVQVPAVEQQSEAVGNPGAELVLPVENPAAQQGVSVENPAAQQGVAAENPAAQQGVAAENPAAQQGVAAENPAAQQGVAAENPAAQQGVAAENLAAQQGVSTENPVAQQGVSAENPAAQQGVSAENPAAETDFPAVASADKPMVPIGSVECKSSSPILKSVLLRGSQPYMNAGPSAERNEESENKRALDVQKGTTNSKVENNLVEEQTSRMTTDFPTLRAALHDAPKLIQTLTGGIRAPQDLISEADLRNTRFEISKAFDGFNILQEPTAEEPPPPTQEVTSNRWRSNVMSADSNGWHAVGPSDRTRLHIDIESTLTNAELEDQQYAASLRELDLLIGESKTNQIHSATQTRSEGESSNQNSSFKQPLPPKSATETQSEGESSSQDAVFKQPFPPAKSSKAAKKAAATSETTEVLPKSSKSSKKAVATPEATDDASDKSDTERSETRRRTSRTPRPQSRQRMKSSSEDDGSDEGREGRVLRNRDKKK